MKEHYYLDNAATTWPKPETVYTTMDTFFRQYGVNPGRAGHDMAVEAERMIVETRRLLAAFFGFAGDPQRVVFTQNATDSLNIAIYGLAAGGGHVISTRLEHNSVLRPLNHLERDHGVTVTRVARDAFGYIDPEDVRKAIRSDTRAVIVNHASNVLGSVQDIAAIGAITRETGVPFVIDTCQSAGVLPIDMDALGVDILTFTGHKGLFGPMGIGGLIVREGMDLPPARVGGTGVDSISPYQPDEYPYHLEAGTVSIPGIAGLNAAQKWFADLGRAQLGDEASAVDHAQACAAALSHIDAREREHIATLENAFRQMDSVTVYGPGNNGARVATLSMNVDAVPADQVGAMLDADHHVCVRAGLHCAPLVHEDEGTVERKGTVRFAPGYFTDEDDLHQAIEGIRDIAG
ncbi:MAG: aminotransferase class V-fold PLP-dependent enzyme [Gammaproteobacteria bacterium]|nr:aminotransferase class V-fold PLP-dependent enzyme [Gammaproteobacteria bacterium]